VIAPASYAQAGIWDDEENRSDSKKPQLAIYNMPFLYRLSPNHTLSTQKLRHALQLVVNKHKSLRTSLTVDTECNLLIQRIINATGNNKNILFTFIESVFETDEQLTHIMHDEQAAFEHFNLTHGLVFRCHIVYYKQISKINLLGDKDALIFNFHHALFDFPSMDIFLDDLNQAYTTGHLPMNDNTSLRYLDCKYT
jgi:hypothetical protein